MSKKSVIATITILFLVTSLLAMINVEVVNANPFFIFHQVDPVPGTIPPKIIMFNPQNSTVYSSDNITISFYVDKPKLDMHDSSIINITYTLDDKTVQAFTIWKDGSAGSDSGIPNFNTSFTSPSLSTGNHNLTVYAEGVVFAGGLAIFFMNSTSIIFFTIDTQSLEPSITSTTNSLTPTSIEVGGLDSIILSNSELIIAVIIVVGICMILGLLLKRRLVVKR